MDPEAADTFDAPALEVDEFEVDRFEADLTADEAVVELQLRQMAYASAMEVNAALLPRSLTDFLR